MLQTTAHPSIAADWSALRDNIELELIAILNSIQFRNSARSSAFLRYVVEQALGGNGHALKERTIGLLVFKRGDEYDTSNDAFVRVRANDVRRRLAEYYNSNQPQVCVRIEMASGSYVPQFLTEEPAPTETAPLSPAPVKLQSGRHNDFWEPLLMNKSSVEIVIEPNSLELLNAALPLVKMASEWQQPLRFVPPGHIPRADTLQISLETVPDQAIPRVVIDTAHAPQCRMTAGSPAALLQTVSELSSRAAFRIGERRFDWSRGTVPDTRQ